MGVTAGSTQEKRKLDDKQVRVLSFIEQLFWETGYVPTNEVVANRLGPSITVKFVADCYKHSTFRQALVARGIDLRSEDSKGVLDPKQIILANLLLNAHDKRSVREKLELANITSQQYHAWMRQPAFSNYLRKRAEEAFKSTDYEAYQGLQKAVQTGDVNALKFFFEMRGVYSPKLQLDINIEGILAQVVEIVQKHVRDSNILIAIADDLEALMVGSGVRRRPVETSVVEATVLKELTNAGTGKDDLGLEAESEQGSFFEEGFSTEPQDC